MELPLVAGVGGGVGTTTLAIALQAIDCGIYRGGTGVDVLVARSTLYSLRCAQEAIAATPEPPILAVVADGSRSGLTNLATARLRMTEAHVAATVMVPFVHDWPDMDNPHEDAAEVLAVMNPVPKSLRGFAGALHQLVDEITPRVVRRSAFEQSAVGRAMPPPPIFAPHSAPAAWPPAQ